MIQHTCGDGWEEHTVIFGEDQSQHPGWLGKRCRCVMGGCVPRRDVTNGRQAARRCSHVFKTVSVVMSAWTASEC